MKFIERNSARREFPDDANQINESVAPACSVIKALKPCHITFNLLNTFAFGGASMHQKANIMATLQKIPDNMSADKTGPACYEYLH
jgi:hypothetical protein